MTRSAFAVARFVAVFGVGVFGAACGSSDDAGGGAVPVSASCNACVANACPGQAAACNDDSTCQACQADVSAASCQSGVFETVAACACGASCATACGNECAAYAEVTKTTGTGAGGTGTVGDGTCGSLAWKSASCAGCMNTSCCQQQATCSANTSCVSLLQCFAAGTDETTCTGEFPDGNEDLNTLGTCLEGPCAAACEASGGAGGGSSVAAQCGIEWTTAGCQTCVDGSCCAQEQACVGSADCAVQLKCLSAGTAQATCAMQFPNGTDGITALSNCLQACQSQCN